MLPSNSSSLNELESIIEEGIATFYAVGSALLEIKDRRLYAPEYPDFESYCEKRWRLNSSQVERRLKSASVIIQLEGQSPKFEAHALELAKIEDPSLRNMAWAAAQERFGDSLTTKNLSDLVNEYITIEDPQLKSLVLAQAVTAREAAKLMQLLAHYPEYYQVAVKNYGIGPDSVVSPEALKVLRLLEYTVKEEILDVLRSGYVYINEEAIPLYALTHDLALYFEKLVYSNLKAELQSKAAREQDEGSSANIVSGEDFSNIMFVPKGETVWFFPERLTKEEILNLLNAAGVDIYMVVGYTKGARLNFDGQPTPIADLHGVKPQVLMDTIEALTCGLDSK